MTENKEVEITTIPVVKTAPPDNDAEEEDEEIVFENPTSTSGSFAVRNGRSSRPGLTRSDSNCLLIESLCTEDHIVHKESGISELKFYVHFMLTFGPIGAGVTLYWRGMWTVLDLYLYPEDLVQSAWASLIIGITTGVICHSISAYSHTKSAGRDNLSLVWYGIQERCFSFLVAFGAVTYWRGVWLLWDGLVLTGDPVLQNWLSLIVGTCILLALRSFRSVFAPPMVYMPDDADDLDGLTLELCDDLWWAPASAMHQRHALSERHFLRVADLLAWKRMQQSERLQKEQSSKVLKSKKTSLLESMDA